MIEFKGKYANGKVFNDHVESSAQEQIIQYLNSIISKNTNPRWMPDIHAGKGCTIGTTIVVDDKIVPNFIGVDIGCGMLTVELHNINTNFQTFKDLDEFIKNEIPFGMGNINQKPNEMIQEAYKQIKEENPELFD